MIGTYLLAASAYWRYHREPHTWAAWSQQITEGEVRTRFRESQERPLRPAAVARTHSSCEGRLRS